MNCCLCQNQFVPGVQRVGTWRSEENSVIEGEDQGTGNSSSRERMPGNILRHFLLSHSAFPSPLHSALLHQYLNTWNRVPQNCCFFFFSLCFSGSPYDHVVNRKPIAWQKSRFSMLLTAGDILQGKTSATQQQIFHTDDINQCLLLVDFGQVLCSSAY